MKSTSNINVGAILDYNITLLNKVSTMDSIATLKHEAKNDHYTYFAYSQRLKEIIPICSEPINKMFNDGQFSCEAIFKLPARFAGEIEAGITTLNMERTKIVSNNKYQELEESDLGLHDLNQSFVAIDEIYARDERNAYQLNENCTIFSLYGRRIHITNSNQRDVLEYLRNEMIRGNLRVPSSKVLKNIKESHITKVGDVFRDATGVILREHLVIHENKHWYFRFPCTLLSI